MLRSRLMLASAPAGLVLGALGWLLFSHGAGASETIADLQSRAQALTPPPANVASAPSAGNLAATTPIFALTTGPGAVAETSVELVGVAKTPVHTAALLVINSKPAEWLTVGETKDDVTLNEVQSDKVTIDTPVGQREIALGAKPAAPASGAASFVPSPSQSGAPPGFRGPLPPASAPGM